MWKDELAKGIKPNKPWLGLKRQQRRRRRKKMSGGKILKTKTKEERGKLPVRRSGWFDILIAAFDSGVDVLWHSS